MRILIVDTSSCDIDLLSENLLAINPCIDICGRFSTIQSAFEWISQHGQPDIVFMDLQLGDGLSFDLLNYLDNQVKIVFTIDFNKPVIEIFENLSINFLQKPYSADQITEILLCKQKTINRIELYESLLNLYFPKAHKKRMRRIIVKKGSEFHIIQVDDVVYFASDNGILFFITKDNQRHMISSTLQDIHSQLDGRLFYRANRNFIVNSVFLKGFRRNGYKMSLVFTIPVKDEIFINNYRVTEFKDWLEGTHAGLLVKI